MTINSDHLDQLGEAMKRFADSHWANEPFADAATIHTSNRVEQDDRTWLLALAVQAVATEMRALRLALTADNVTDMPALVPATVIAPALSAEQIWALTMLKTEAAPKQHAVLHCLSGSFHLLIDDVKNIAVSNGEFMQLAELGLIYCDVQSSHWFTSSAGRHALRMHGVTS